MFFGTADGGLGMECLLQVVSKEQWREWRRRRALTRPFFVNAAAEAAMVWRGCD